MSHQAHNESSSPASRPLSVPESVGLAPRALSRDEQRILDAAARAEFPPEYWYAAGRCSWFKRQDFATHDLRAEWIEERAYDPEQKVLSREVGEVLTQTPEPTASSGNGADISRFNKILFETHTTRLYRRAAIVDESALSHLLAYFLLKCSVTATFEVVHSAVETILEIDRTRASRGSRMLFKVLIYLTYGGVEPGRIQGYCLLRIRHVDDRKILDAHQGIALAPLREGEDQDADWQTKPEMVATAPLSLLHACIVVDTYLHGFKSVHGIAVHQACLPVAVRLAGDILYHLRHHPVPLCLRVKIPLEPNDLRRVDGPTEIRPAGQHTADAIRRIEEYNDSLRLDEERLARWDDYYRVAMRSTTHQSRLVLQTLIDEGHEGLRKSVMEGKTALPVVAPGCVLQFHSSSMPPVDRWLFIRDPRVSFSTTATTTTATTTKPTPPPLPPAEQFLVRAARSLDDYIGLCYYPAFEFSFDNLPQSAGPKTLRLSHNVPSSSAALSPLQMRTGPGLRRGPRSPLAIPSHRPLVSAGHASAVRLDQPPRSAGLPQPARQSHNYYGRPVSCWCI